MWIILQTEMNIAEKLFLVQDEAEDDEMGAVEEGSDEGSDDEEASVADTNDMEYETVSVYGYL